MSFHKKETEKIELVARPDVFCFHFRCHVFRCDVPARAVANALRDICKKILIERSLAQSSSKLIGASAAAGSSFDQVSSLHCKSVFFFLEYLSNQTATKC